MGLADIVSSGVNSAFGATVDLQDTVNYKFYNGSAYNTTTGEVTYSIIEQDVVCFVLDVVSEERLENQSKGYGEKKLIAKKTSFQQTPTTKDKVVIEGITYNVRQIIAAPSDSIYTIICGIGV